MCQVLGYNVTTLKRVRVMNITLANLPVGKWRYFTADEIKTIEANVSSSVKTEDGSYFE